MNSIKICIITLFFCILFPIVSFCEPIIETPSFMLTGVEYEITVRNLRQTDPFQYKINSSNKTLVSGIANPNQDLKVKLTLHNSGINNLILTAGNEETSFSIKAISGICSIIPPILAIILILLTKQIFYSILFGIFTGALFLNDYNLLEAFFQTINKYWLHVASTESNFVLIMLIISSGALLGIIYKMGSLQYLNKKFQFFGPVMVQLTTWFAGLLSAFNDMYSAILIGTSIKHLSDNAKISREKFSYIVNSSVVSSIGLSIFSAWFAIEITLINQALNIASIPTIESYELFFKMFPYRFYSLLTLFFVFFIITTKKDFGPMHESEIRAKKNKKQLNEGSVLITTNEEEYNKYDDENNKTSKSFLIIIITLITSTLILIPITGGFTVPHFKLLKISDVSSESNIEYRVIKNSPNTKTITVTAKDLKTARLYYDETIANKDIINELSKDEVFYGETNLSNIDFTNKIRAAFEMSDSTKALFLGSILTIIVSILFGKIQKTITLDESFKFSMSGIKTVLPIIFIFTASLGLNEVCKDIGTSYYIASYMSNFIPYWIVPTITLVTTMAIAFTTGSGISAMTIMLPIVAITTIKLNQVKYEADIATMANAPTMVLYIKNALIVNIAAIFEGAVFGVHCSPLSPTTIITSAACETDHIDHIKTQSPYVALVGLISIIFCFIPAGLGLSPYLLLVISGMVIAFFVLAFGKSRDIQYKQNQ